MRAMVLGAEAGDRGVTAVMDGEVLDLSRRGLALRLPSPVPISAPIKVEAEDLLLLGEVYYCQREERGFRVGVMLEHRLGGFEHLRSLNAALREEALRKVEAREAEQMPART